jgi:hypothetical protein
MRTTADLHSVWAYPTQLGSQDMIFIEDNTFSYVGGLPHVTDTNYAGRFVFRFNIVTQMAVEVHSLQAWRGSRAWEIYQNTFSFPEGGWTIGLIRGGTGVAWGNTEQLASPSWVLDNVRSFNAGYQYGDCNGSSTADGNSSGFEGWQCRDQIGRGQDSCLSRPSDLTASATGWCRQASEPVYFFLNRTATGGIIGIETGGRGRSSTLHVLTDRDFYNETSSFNGSSGTGSGPLANRPASCTPGVAYWATDQGEWNSLTPGPDGQLYKCSAQNSWSLYYRPYQYPHPLQQGSAGSGAGPTAPGNLRIISSF